MALGTVPTPLQGWDLRHGGCWMVRMATGGEDTVMAVLPDTHGSAASPHAQGAGTTRWEMQASCILGFPSQTKAGTQWGSLGCTRFSVLCWGIRKGNGCCWGRGPGRTPPSSQGKGTERKAAFL